MFTTPRLVAIALCAALNFAIGNIVYLVKLPVYLDSIGTILCALLISITVPANARSRAVMERLGLTYRGIAQWRGLDVVWYAVDR